MDRFWHVQSDLREDQQKTKKRNTFTTERKVDPEIVVVSFIPEFGKMIQLTLPVDAEGKYTFDYRENAKIKNALAVQAYEGKWFLYSVKPVYLQGKDKQFSTFIELKNQQEIQIINADEKCFVFVEFLQRQEIKNHNHRIISKELLIGSSEKCDIRYKSNLIGPEEAEIIYSYDRCYIRSKNADGLILNNGRRMTKGMLDTGDIIYIKGLKIIVGIGFLSINSNHESVVVNRSKLMQMNEAADIVYFEASENRSAPGGTFNRFPRKRLPLVDSEIQIDSPPMQLNGDRIPLMLRMGGSMVMGASSLVTGNPTMMISSVLFPILNSKYTEKQRKEYEKRRVEKYTEYLEKKRAEIQKEKDEEEYILNYNYPDLQEVLTFPEHEKRLWERRKQDDDFLSIRLGYGDVPLHAKYRYNEERFSLEEDVLEDNMYELVNQKVVCQDAPIMTSLIEDYICGVLGAKSLTFSFIKRIVMQMAITHSYDEVKMIFLSKEKDIENIEFVKYLPHIWDDEKTFRFLATDSSEAYQISKYLKNVLEDELGNDFSKSMKIEEILRKRPYYVVFALDKKLFDAVEILQDIMQLDFNAGISIITAFDDLPKECFKIFQLQSDGNNSVTFLRELDQGEIYFKMDRYEEKIANKVMKEISNISLGNESESAVLPKMVTFLEMFGVGKLEHLNILQRWKENNPVRSLATPIGVAPDGSPFMLDLHQQYHGPHGLIAGMTGSGKSEFIITYILSMAINYRPDEVSFLLIDYKGGGLTSAFEDPVRGIYLPHLAGTITNLDGAAINRSLISIQSEMTRRQQLLKEAKGKVEESTVDIYSYQKLYREGKVSEPLPHLLIIADEFAEMKQQEPEFMDSLISIARIGRSLGVHLILATQKPSGVVNDQIRSNTKFRVCLKVQDKSDSMDMLKRPEGAEIKETGRFYLQVGYNELFAMGQSAWTGADYEPQDELIVKKDDSIVFLDNLGQSLHEEKPVLEKKATGRSQLSEIVKYLSAMAEAEGISRTQIWNDPLPKLVDSQNSDVSFKESELKVFLGLIDDPVHQRQYPYVYDLCRSKNLLIVGATKSGKTSLVQNFLYQLTMGYSAEDVNYYILDYSSHLMKMFSPAPHCGAVLSEEDGTASRKLFGLIGEIAEERRKLFDQLEVDNFNSAREKQKIPVILLIIDNISGFSSSKETESIYMNLNSFMKKIENFGIYFVITCTHLNEVTMRVRQEIGDRIVFDAKDKYEYQDVLECRINYIPPSFPGRGLLNVQGSSLEFQAAIYGAQLSQTQRIEHMKNDLIQAAERKSAVKARKIPYVAQDEAYEDFSSMFPRGRIPLGYAADTEKAVALPLKQLKTLAMYWGNKKSTIPVMENILQRACYEEMKVTVIARKENSIFSKGKQGISPALLENIHVVDCEAEAIYEEMRALLMDMLEEKHYIEEYCQEQGLVMKEATQMTGFRDQIYSYMAERIVPRLIILENVKDICESANAEATAALNGVCISAPLYNTYLIHCYSPGEDAVVKEHAIRRVLSDKEMTLLYGGCYDKQTLVDVGYTYRNVKTPIEYNKGLMQYRGNIYELTMPCRQLEEEVLDEDDAPIF